jgi:hypothetical protein
MIKTSYFLFAIFFFFLNCSPIKESLEKRMSNNIILSIKDYNYANYLQTVDIYTSDTIYIISPKDTFYRKYNIPRPVMHKKVKKMKPNDTINFELSKVKFQANTMQQLGVHIIIENDTLWSGAEIIDNKFYQSLNSIGLLVNDK